VYNTTVIGFFVAACSDIHFPYYLTDFRPFAWFLFTILFGGYLCPFVSA
jgi:hypothetical protein